MGPFSSRGEMIRRVLALGMVLLVGALLVFVVLNNLSPFGTFPDRPIPEGSIGQHILEESPEKTGAANVVTSVVWSYRGYDTLGEVTVLFTAVVGIIMIFRVIRREKS
jgi:multicomponent Na+:H+ antiporter subunit B